MGGTDKPQLVSGYKQGMIRTDNLLVVSATQVFASEG